MPTSDPDPHVGRSSSEYGASSNKPGLPKPTPLNSDPEIEIPGPFDELKLVPIPNASPVSANEVRLNEAEISRQKRLPELGTTSENLNALMHSDPARGEALLVDFYWQFRKAFRDPDEVRSIHEYRALITKDSGLWIDLLMVGNELVGAANTRVIDTPEGKVGITEHIFIKDSYRGKGLGGHLNDLVNERAREAGAVAIVQEVTDPRLVSQTKRAMDLAAGIDPEGRISFWGKQGFVALDAPYAQPQLAEGKMPVYCDMLTIKPLDAELRDRGQITVDSYLAIVKSYFQTFIDDVDADPTYRMLLKAKDHLKTVEFLPLQEPRKALFPAFWAFVDQCNRGEL